MSIQETFPEPSRELSAHHLPMYSRDKDTQAMWWFSMMNDSMCRYKDSGRYAEGSWGYTVLRTTYSDESNTLRPIVLGNLRRWVTQYFVHLNRLATNKSDSSVNEELGRRFILEEVDVDSEKINVPDLDKATQDDIKALTNVFDYWLRNAVGDVDGNAEFNIQDSARFCDFLVIDEGSLRSLAALPKETPSLELVSREERRARDVLIATLRSPKTEPTRSTSPSTLLAASSFVGQGVITSDVYISDNVEWYLNTANFLRSVRNFKIDIRPASPWSYLCGIHWQVAQATSLENIEFYMLYESDVPGNNQQVIYMENGSGGFLADLTFVGGHFGAYFGNQQFTTSHLVFVSSVIALQVHWDWAWTMQDFVIESCGTGLLIIGGAGGPQSTGQSVGSLILVDSIIANTPKGIVTTLFADNSTSFLLQNVGFFNTVTAITDDTTGKVLLAGGNEVVVDNWGFGLVTTATNGDGKTSFANGVRIPVMKRSTALLGDAYDKMAPNLFTRRRPGYLDVAAGKVMNVRTLGAKGDGVTDDTMVLNSILEGAANTSSVVFIPYGVYIVTDDTLRVPVGSRIIGQVWSQIMGTGDKFADETQPRPVVQVGKAGDVGIAEITGMMVTVKGATAGAVAIEWNRSPFYGYDTFIKSQLDYILSQCTAVGRNTTTPGSPLDLPDRSTYCQTNKMTVTAEGDTCDSIAESHSLASAALYAENPNSIYDCSSIAAGTSLCLPPSCAMTWTVKPDDNCFTIEYNVTATTLVSVIGNIQMYNRWVDRDCTNLQTASDAAFGHVICLAPQNGEFAANSTVVPGDTTIPADAPGYSHFISDPPIGATVAAGTTLNCGTWRVAVSGDKCSTAGRGEWLSQGTRAALLHLRAGPQSRSF
ncbi:hypothetical protein VE02_05927 [Pseudogymnoascus sp. 03VT05]|nr:hypothetical protein VE02_05927 [Pseudogymnoascus sp. 03VT05]